MPEDLFQSMNLDFDRPVPGGDGQLFEAEVALSAARQARKRSPWL